MPQGNSAGGNSSNNNSTGNSNNNTNNNTPNIRRNSNVDDKGHHKFSKAFQTLADGADMLIKAAVRLSTISFDKEFESIAAISRQSYAI